MARSVAPPALSSTISGATAASAARVSAFLMVLPFTWSPETAPLKRWAPGRT
jgi:hypothetical protein